MKHTKLGLLVFGLNLLKAKSKRVLTEVLPLLEPMVGQKLFLANGDRSKKLNAVTLPKREEFTPKNEEVIYGTQFSFYLSCEHGTRMYLKARVMVNGENGTHYFDSDYYLGQIEDGVLKTFEGLERTIVDYNLNEVLSVEDMQEKIKAYEDLKLQADAAKNAIPSKIKDEMFIR